MSELGRFRIVIRLRIDNPAFPQYLIYVGYKLVGKQFSVPTVSDCEWLERQEAMERLVYAQQSARLFEHSIQARGCYRGHRYPTPEEEESA
mgnify:CR=1 FL=1